jgi:AcrR family transcriptional regulator
MDAALRLVTEGGPDAFTVSEAAREAGVSSGAPYRHFADRRALLRAVAEEGHELHAQALEEAVREADPRQRLAALGEAEVRFALEHPAYYRVMWAPEYRDAEDDAVAQEIEANRARAEAAPGSRDAAAMLAAQCAIYGLARLAADGQLGADLDADQLASAACAMIATIRAR